MRINRAAAIGATIERNPNAFRPKIAASKQTLNNSSSLQGTPLRSGVAPPIHRHSKG